MEKNKIMKMHEKKLKHFKIYSKIANVLFILFIGAGILSTLAGLLVFAYTKIEDANFASLILEKILSDSSLAIQIIGAETLIPNGVIFTIIFFGVFTLFFTALIIKLVGNMFKNIVVTRTPFNDNVVKTLKVMGIAFFVMASITYIFKSVLSSNFTQEIILTGFDGIDFKNIMFGILLLALGEIFEFGKELQQDSESIL